MKRVTGCILLLLQFAALDMFAQATAAPSPQAKRRETAAAKTAPAPDAKAADKDPLKAMFGGGKGAAATDGPVTTEIYADEVYFDTGNSIGTFTGRVIVNDPRFNLQADKLTVYVAKGAQKGLEKAVAEGNVGVVHERPGENGAAPVRSIGRADRAVYTVADGNVELSGTPRVQSGLNSHVATSPDTVMLLNQAGQLTTKGPSRTEIRQEPKTAATPKP